jgi:hypothetical protein
MSTRDYYRTKAAEFYVRAQNESRAAIRRRYESMANHYSRLAEKAARDATVKSPRENARKR